MLEFDTHAAGKALAALIDDLSNWYVRRCRRRFWAGEPSALATLHECLEVLTRLVAPFVPFTADAVWHHLVAPAVPGSPDSVHLAPWPEPDPTLVDDEVEDQVALSRRLVELGRAARAASGVKTRQPLARALLASTSLGSLMTELRAEVADELNVAALAELDTETAGALVDVSVKPNFRALGKRFGSMTKAVAAAVAATSAVDLAAATRSGGTASVTVDGEPVELTADDLVVTETPRSGWSVSAAHGETVALDLAVTPDLEQLGLVRDLVRLVQDARRRSGLDVSDRIELWWWDADDAVTAALRGRGDLLATEVLAVSLMEGPPTAPLPPHRSDLPRVTFWLRVAGG